MRRFLVGALLLVFLPITAKADLGDCNDPAYLSNFADVGYGDVHIDISTLTDTTGFSCIEEFRRSFQTPGGTRTIRGIRSGRDTLPADQIARIESGVDQAIAAFGALGDYAIDDVTILLAGDMVSARPPLADHPEPPEFYAAARTPPDDLLTTAEPECHITFLTKKTATLPGDGAATALVAAHELFHCLQHATVASAFFNAQAWWREGTAEAFSAFAVRGSEIVIRHEAFEGAINDSLALDYMEHESGPFFYWLIEQHGIGQLVSDMRLLASAENQPDGMRALLDQQEWLEFAQAVADARIRHPHGFPVRNDPQAGEAFSIDDSTDVRMWLVGFAVYRGWLTLECGTWRIDQSPDDLPLSIREEDSTEWKPLPETIEIGDRAAGAGTMRLAGFYLEDETIEAALKFERVGACQPCAGRKMVDPCLAGTWQMSGGGPGEWMDAMGLPMTSFNQSTGTYVVESDGTYLASPQQIDFSLEKDRCKASGTGSEQLSTGFWAAEEGEIAICNDQSAIQGFVEVVCPNSVMSGPIALTGGSEVVWQYSCNASEMSLSIPMDGLPPIVTTYSRMSPPPSDVPETPMPTPRTPPPVMSLE